MNQISLDWLHGDCLDDERWTTDCGFGGGYAGDDDLFDGAGCDDDEGGCGLNVSGDDAVAGRLPLRQAMRHQKRCLHYSSSYFYGCPS